MGDHFVHMGHGIFHALAHVAIAAVAQFDGFVGTGAGAGGNDGPAETAGRRIHFHFYRGISAAV